MQENGDPTRERRKGVPRTEAVTRQGHSRRDRSGRMEGRLQGEKATVRKPDALDHTENGV